MSDSDPVKISYFSDVLCVWAYLAEARLDEIRERLGGQIEITARYCSVFGDTAEKIGVGWAARGGYEGFNRHLREIDERFEHIHVHPDLWLKVRPASSLGIHLFLKAAQLASEEASDELAWRLRCAFFEQCRDIADASVQREIAKDIGMPISAMDESIGSGAAFASLAADLAEKDRLGVSGSPTYVLNEGRQKLFGNVGYRVIEANIQELLRPQAVGEASWC